jgi:hypothetical protein
MPRDTARTSPHLPQSATLARLGRALCAHWIYLYTWIALDYWTLPPVPRDVMSVWRPEKFQRCPVPGSLVPQFARFPTCPGGRDGGRPRGKIHRHCILSARLGALPPDSSRRTKLGMVLHEGDDHENHECCGRIRIGALLCNKSDVVRALLPTGLPLQYPPIIIPPSLALCKFFLRTPVRHKANKR